MIYRCVLLFISCMIFSFSFGFESTMPLDTLLEKRLIDKQHAELFAKIPIQDSGDRIKPFHTICSEILRKIARTDVLYNQTSTQIVIGMTVDPLLWQIIPIIKVSDLEVLSILNQNIDTFANIGNHF